MGKTPRYAVKYEIDEHGVQIPKGIKTFYDGKYYEGIFHPADIPKQKQKQETTTPKPRKQQEHKKTTTITRPAKRSYRS